MGGKDPVLQAIEEAIPIPQKNLKVQSRNLDVRHLYQCAKSQAEIFWTEDHRTILQHVDALANAGIHVKSTEQILAHLSS